MMELALILRAYAKLNEIVKAQREIDKVQSNVQEVNRTAQRSISIFRRIENAIRTAFDTRAIENFKNKLGDVGENILTGLGVKEAAETVIGAFAELENARIGMEVAFMQKGGELPTGELQEINRIAIELGNRLPGTTADFYRLAQALKEQGVSTKAIAKGALEASAYLGALFKVPYEEAGRMTAKFQEAFKVPEKQLVEFIDLVQRSKFAFGLELQDIYYSVKYFSASLNTLGITGMENAKKIMAWMGVLAGKGLEGSMAGTAIQAVLSSLTKLKNVPEEAGRILSAYGIELNVFDVFGRFRGLDALFKEIQKLKVLTQEERMQVLKSLFGEEGARAIAPLLNDVEALSQALEKIQRQANLNERVKIQLSSLSAKWEAFTGTLQNVFAQLGSYLSPTLKFILDKLNDLLGSLQLWIENHKTLATVLMHLIGGLVLFAGTLTTLGAVTWGALQIWLITSQGLRTLSAVLQILRIRLLLARGATLAFAGVRTVLTVLFLMYQGFYALSYLIYTRYLRAITLARMQTLALMALNKLRAVFFGLATAVRAFSLTLLTNPIGIIATTIALAGFLIYRNWDKVKGLWEALKSKFKKLISYLKSLNLFEAGKKIILTLTQGIKSVALAPVKAVQGVVQKIRNFLPFSPAKEGPLRDLHLTGIRLVQTIAHSITPVPIQRALASVLTLPILNLPAVPPKSFQVKESSAVEKSFTEKRLYRGIEKANYQVQVTVNVNAPMTKEVRDQTARELQRAILKALKEYERKKEIGTYKDDNLY